MIKKYFWNLWIAFDQFLNALMGGDPDETVSSRFGRRWPDSWFSKLLNRIIGDRHVQQSIEPDEGKDDIIK